MDHPTPVLALHIHPVLGRLSLTTLCPVVQARFGTPNAARLVVSHSFEQTMEEPAAKEAGRTQRKHVHMLAGPGKPSVSQHTWFT